jgi:hypothetical protein
MDRHFSGKLFATAAVGIALLPGASFAQQKSLNEQLIGTWTVISVDQVRPDGTKVELYGPNPIGILIFASDGHFAILNARSDLPKLAAGSRDRGTPEENKAVVEGSLAYYGTYRVNETGKVIIVSVQGSTFANLVGTEQKRIITSLTTSELAFINPAASSGGTLQLVWKRANYAIE